MARKTAEKQDLLGLFALGSVITNLAQAEGKNRIQAELLQLRNMFFHLRGRYGHVCQEYERMKALNDQLQREVVALRTENNKLLASTGTKR